MSLSTPFIHRLGALALAVALAAGCRVNGEYPLPDDFGTCEDTAGEASTSVPGMSQILTYYADAKPILDAKCKTCHEQGNIGPFALDTFEDAFGVSDQIRTAVMTDGMPPWQPDDCCREYRWDRSLTEEQRATLITWVEQGALPGDPDNEAPALDVDNGGLSRVDVTLTMPEPFTPQPVIGRDEVRCFVLDWPFEDEVFVTGINVVPGDRRMVHHVVVAAVDESDVAALRAREAEDERPGWDCYGEVGGEGQITATLGGWAPGYQGVELPDGLGRRIPKNSAVVLNVHYDTGSGIGADQTSIEVMVEDQVEREALGVGVGNPLWLLGDGMQIEANDPDAMVYFSYDPTVLMTRQKAFAIYSVNIHMHELGTIGRLAILRADGSIDCLLNITDWDFDWLGEYYFEQPVIFEPGDELFVECHWDNTAANQKIVDGELQEPRTIAWGTDEEMCGGILTIVELEDGDTP